MKNEDFLTDILYILRETFEGSPEGQPSAYLDRGIGFFSTLDGLNAEQVSKSIDETTIAAHTEHAKFYLDRLIEFAQGKKEPIKWEQSWLIEQVTVAEWDTLRKGLRNSYEKVLRVFAGIEVWNLDSIGGAIAIIAHTAYHLGAIRQLSKRI